MLAAPGETIACAILAGGRSSRMGEDKTLMPLHGKTLIEHVSAVAGAVYEEVYIISKDCGKFAFLGTPCISEEYKLSASICGVLSAFEHLRHKSIAYLPADTPFLTSRVLKRLLAAYDGPLDGVVARSEGAHNLIAIYNRSCYERFKEAYEKERFSIGRAVNGMHIEYVDFEESEAFMNLNSMEEFSRAQRLEKSYGAR